MQKERRKFIATAGLVIGGAATGGVQLLASESVDPERDVLDVVSRYGARKNTVRSESNVEITVRMDSPQAFVKVFDPMKGLPFENIQAGAGNTLSFDHQGVRFTLRNVA